MINIVQEFKNYVSTIPSLIHNSAYKTQYFIKLLGLKEPTYYRKLKDNKFTVEEIELLTKALYPKEVLLMELEIAERDYENGNVIAHDELSKKLRKEFL